MKTNTSINILIIIFCLISFSCFAQVSKNNKHKNSIAINEKELNDSATLNYSIINNPQYLFNKEIQEIVKKEYELKYKSYESILLTNQWIVMIFIAIITLMVAVSGFILKYWLNVKIKEVRVQYEKGEKTILEAFKVKEKEIKEKLDKHAELALKEFQDSSKKAFDAEKDRILKDLKESSKRELDEAILKFREDVILRRKAEVYQLGVINFNKREYEIALSNFVIAYKSSYLLEKTCYHLGKCYRMIKDAENALKYLQEAILLNENNLAYLKEILKEIGEIIKDETDKTLDETNKALSYFIDLYKSSYCLETTCYLMGICYKYLKDKKNALLYLRQAESLNLNNPNFFSEIRREINEIEKSE